MKYAKVESLESRIAPAVFYLSGTTGTLLTATGGNAFDSVPEMNAVTDTHADAAVLLDVGDSLVFDANGNNKTDIGEPVLLKAVKGTAMAFFTDLNTNVGSTPRFDLSEFTGLAVSNGSVAIVNANINGSIDALLDPAGFFHKTRPVANIAGITITGSVSGNIQAGGSISNVVFKTPSSGAPLYDVDRIATGSGAIDVSFNGGGFTVPISFTQAPGTDAGDISDLTLPHGVFGDIVAGNGGDTMAGNGGAGGDITGVKIRGFAGVIAAGWGGQGGTGGVGGKGGVVSNLTVDISRDRDGLTIAAGNGGPAALGSGASGGDGGAMAGAKVSGRGTTGAINFAGGHGGSGDGVGAGGAGGALTDVMVKLSDRTTSDVSISAGNGGAGGAMGAGGRGGDATRVAMTLAQGVGDHASLLSGNGGTGGAMAAGGAGGNVEACSIKSGGFTGDSISIFSGAGGDGGSGGASGNIHAATLSVANSLDDVYLFTGQGGDGTSGAGGASGKLSDSSLTVTGYVASNVNVKTGRGGDAGGGNFDGGASGAISNITVKITGYVASDVLITPDAGGDGSGSGKGGDGGAITKANITSADVSSDIFIIAGDGGVAGKSGGTGGRGGDLAQIVATNTGYVGNTVLLIGGTGGKADGTSGNGGDGGNTSAVTYTNKGGTGFLGIYSGFGGRSEAASGDGGDGGAFTKLTVNNLAQVEQAVEIFGGHGGSGATNGGNAKDTTDFKITDSSGAPNFWEVYAGNGRAGTGTGGHGGNGGDLKRIVFNGPAADVTFGYSAENENAGGTGMGSIGGKGGSLSAISGSAKVARFIAQEGGDADETGGTGGSISGVNFKVTRHAQVIAAGDGGDVKIGAEAGLGGSISGVVITGTGVIGDYSESFGSDPANLGGLVVGRGGAVGTNFDVDRNGSITNVTAKRVAAIFAGGTPSNVVNVDNAVKAIAGLKVAFIGADFDNDGELDWQENTATQTGFQLSGFPGTTDTDDRPFDGLVIVKAGGFTPLATTRVIAPIITV